MRGFIVLCLTAVAVAAPQGYNYNPANGGGAIGAGLGGGIGGGIGGGAQQATGFGGSFGASTGNGLTSSGGSAGFFQGGQQQGYLGQGSQQHQQAIVSKRFYIHSAPEEADEDYKEKHITVGVPKRNYNVVFIKSPQRGNKKTAIKISPAVNEDKTVIYVLSKKTDASDVHAEVVEHATSTSKPEVFFIKYKTNEEASHAQQQIQAQYDALGGSSQVTDEGVAPVTSVIGALGGGDAHADGGAAVGAGAGAGQGGFSQGGSFGGSHGGAGAAHAGNNAYLPPNF